MLSDVSEVILQKDKIIQDENIKEHIKSTSDIVLHSGSTFDIDREDKDNKFCETYYDKIVKKMYTFGTDIHGSNCIFRKTKVIDVPIIDSITSVEKEVKEVKENESNKQNKQDEVDDIVDSVTSEKSDDEDAHFPIDLNNINEINDPVNEIKIDYSISKYHNLNNLTDELVKISYKAAVIEAKSMIKISEILLYVILSQVNNDYYLKNGCYYLDIIKILEIFYYCMQNKIKESLDRILPLQKTTIGNALQIKAAVESNRILKTKRSNLTNSIIKKVMKTIGFFLYVLYKNKPKHLTYIDKLFPIKNVDEFESAKINDVFILANELNNLNLLSMSQQENEFEKFARITYILSYRRSKSDIDSKYFMKVISSNEKNKIKLEDCKQLLQDYIQKVKKKTSFMENLEMIGHETVNPKRSFNQLTNAADLFLTGNKVSSYFYS